MNYFIFIVSLIVFFIVIDKVFCKNASNYNCFSQAHTTVLKGIAIIVIMMTHFLNNKTNFSNLTPLAGMAVCLFLICSGYGISESYKKKGLKNFFFSKILKIWIPFFIVITTVELIYHSYSLKEYVLGCFFIKNIHCYGWYMRLLLLDYVFFYVDKKLMPNNKKFIFSCLLAIGLFMMKEPLYAEQAISFLTGIFISQYNINKKIEKITTKQFTLVVLSTIVIIVTAYITRNIAKDIYTLNTLIWAVYKYFIAILLILITYKWQKIFNNKIFYYAGIYSYSIYLIHGYMFFTVNTIDYLTTILYFAVTIILSIIFTKMIDIAT